MEFAGNNSFTAPTNISPFELPNESEDWGRESLGIFDINNVDFGRESLGPFDINNTNFGRESLSRFNMNNTDFGRESLGIVDLSSLDIGRESVALLAPPLATISECKTPEIVITETVPSLLNIGHLKLPSVGSSVSFNSGSLESYPSKILTETPPSVFNDAFNDSAQYINKLQVLQRKTSSSQNSPWQTNRHRIYSLPDDVKINLEDYTKDSPRNFKDDLVFIEANHLASRIGDLSIYQAEDMLDSFTKPSELSESVIIDKEEVGTKSPELLSESLTDKEEVLEPEVGTKSPELLSDPVIEEKVCENASKNSSSKSQAIDIINTLSGMLNENASQELKTSGQHHLSCLAEILLSGASSKSCTQDDSGHSSIEEEEALDLRKKSNSDSECAPLDLSLKSNRSEKGFISPKILPPKYSNSNAIKSSISKSLDSVNKFKPKKIEPRKVQGPLKAIIPINNVTKTKLKITPKQDLKLARIKKTSTPINELVLKPVAQSTPGSPIARPDASLDANPKKLNYSGLPVPQKSSLQRRGSSGELKKQQPQKLFTRSHSMGEKRSGLQENRIKSNAAKCSIKKSGKENF